MQSIFTEEQKDISNTFARPSEDRFANLSWSKCLPKPADQSCRAWFDCTTYQVVDAGDHAILIGKVEDFASTGFAGLGYYRGGYFTPKLSAEVISGPKVVMRVQLLDMKIPFCLKKLPNINGLFHMSW